MKGREVKTLERDLTQTIGAILESEIAPMFNREIKLTLIARLPGDSEADVLVTSDSLHEIAAVIERSKNREEII